MMIERFNKKSLSGLELVSDFHGSPLEDGKRTFRVKTNHPFLACRITFEVTVGDEERGRMPNLAEVCEGVERLYYAITSEGRGE